MSTATLLDKKSPFNQSEYRRQYYQNHKAKILKRSREYYQEHKDRMLQRMREHYRQYGKDYYSKHRAEEIIRSREKRQRKKMEVLTHYSLGNFPQCALCGIVDIDVLCIDHINGNGARQKRQNGIHGGNAFYWWLKQNGYPSGFQVLCANCNIKKKLRDPIFYVREALAGREHGGLIR